jgi:hypothetical protein
MIEDRKGVMYDRDKNEYITSPGAAARRRREMNARVKRESDCANEIVDAVLGVIDAGRRGRVEAVDAVRVLIVRYHEEEEEADR